MNRRIPTRKADLPDWDVAEPGPPAPSSNAKAELPAHRKAVAKAERRLKEAKAALALAEKEAKREK